MEEFRRRDKFSRLTLISGISGVRHSLTSSVDTVEGGWDPVPSGNPSSTRPKTVPSKDVVNKCFEFAAKAREMTGPACTSAEFSSSTYSCAAGMCGSDLRYADGTIQHHLAVAFTRSGVCFLCLQTTEPFCGT